MSRRHGFWARVTVLAAALLVSPAAHATLLHRWSFSESGGAGTVLNDPVGGATGTIVNVGSNDGTVGGGQVTLAGGSKGSSDYVDFQNNLVGALPDASFETWATQHSVQNWSRVFDFGQDTSNYVFMSWTRGTNINRDRAGMKIGSETSVDDTMSPYTLDQQFHIVMTIDDDGGPDGQTQIKLYRDGVLRGIRNTPHDLTSVNDVNNWLGRSQYGDNTANASWDEFRIYNETLRQNQILHNAGLGPDAYTATAPGDYPHADWTFNTDHDGNPVTNGQALPGGVNGAKLLDVTGNLDPRHQGTIYQQPHYAAYDPTELRGRSGDKDGWALVTGGSDVNQGYVYFRDDHDLATNTDFSLWTRVKRLSDLPGSADEFVFCRPHNWDFAVNSGGTLDFSIGAINGDTGIPINVGQWYDLGLTFEGSGAAGTTDTIRVYMDGVPVGSWTGDALFGTGDWLHIGAGPGGNNDFHGLYDRVLFWDHVVSALTMNRLTVPEPGTLVLLGGGLVALARRRRRQARRDT